MTISNIYFIKGDENKIKPKDIPQTDCEYIECTWYNDIIGKVETQKDINYLSLKKINSY